MPIPITASKASSSQMPVRPEPLPGLLPVFGKSVTPPVVSLVAVTSAVAVGISVALAVLVTGGVGVDVVQLIVTTALSCTYAEYWIVTVLSTSPQSWTVVGAVTWSVIGGAPDGIVPKSHVKSLLEDMTQNGLSVVSFQDGWLGKTLFK
jgi:hypothetical protein